MQKKSKKKITENVIIDPTFGQTFKKVIILLVTQQSTTLT